MCDCRYSYNAFSFLRPRARVQNAVNNLLDGIILPELLLCLPYSVYSTGFTCGFLWFLSLLTRRSVYCRSVFQDGDPIHSRPISDSTMPYHYSQEKNCHDESREGFFFCVCQPVLSAFLLLICIGQNIQSTLDIPTSYAALWGLICVHQLGVS